MRSHLLRAVLLAAALTLAASASVLLDMPFRRQRDDADGYCGETSVSSVCVYYGCWISPEDVRQRATGSQALQILVNGPMVAQLTRMGLASSEFDTTAAQGATSYQTYLLWIKQQLASLYPVITTVYTYSGAKIDNDYDHIELAIGYESSAPSDFTNYNAADTLSSYSLMTDDPGQCAVDNHCLFTYVAGTRPFSDWVALSQRNNDASASIACKYDYSAGGCFPRTNNYGIVVTGALDANAQALPVRLRHVANLTNTTSNIYVGVQMRNLAAGSSYTLVRYNAPANVPANPASADAFLSATYQSACTFKAAAASAEYCDPAPLAWSSNYVYRLVDNAKLSAGKVPATACAASQIKDLAACPLTASSSASNSGSSKMDLIAGLVAGLGGGAALVGVGIAVWAL